MKYQRIVRYLMTTPWAIRPEVLEAVVDIVAFRVEGGHWSADEIRARIGEVEAARRSPSRKGAVAVIPIQGLIAPKMTLFTEISGGTSLRSFTQAFRAAVADDDIAGILLDVDSPGGLADLVPETAREIREARGSKPIVAVANTEAASAAYWLGTQADELVVSPSGMVGSVGAFSVHDDLSKFYEQKGIKTSLISAGKYKTEGNPYEPLAVEAREAIQSIVDDYYGMFLADVATARGVSVKRVQEGYGEGRMVTAGKAVVMGMADRVATFDEVLSELLTRPGVRTPRAPGAVTGPVVIETKAIAPHSTDVVNVPWDGPGQEAKISNDAGASTFRRMYAWADPDGDPDTKAAYKFPHHQVEDGQPKAANVNGCRNALSRLPQSDVPSSDHEGVRRHCQKHIDDFNGTKSAAMVPGAEQLLKRRAVREAFAPAS